MQNKISFYDLLPTMEEKLIAGGEVTFIPEGRSMRPMFRGGIDKITLVRKNGRLKKYDLPFYRRSDGRYILHRVIKVCDNYYVCRGDGTFTNEIGIKDKEILGVVKSFEKKGKTRNCNSFGFKVYSVLWVNTCQIRKLFHIIFS